MFLIAIVLNSS